MTEALQGFLLLSRKLRVGFCTNPRLPAQLGLSEGLRCRFATVGLRLVVSLSRGRNADLLAVNRLSPNQAQASQQAGLEGNKADNL